MPFIVQLFWAVFVSILTKELFSPEPPKLSNLDQKAQTTVDAPTINEGTSVSVIFGTVLTNRQNVSWYGGLNSVPFTTDTTRGFKYKLTAQLSVCMGPIDRIREIRFDDITVPAANITVTDHTDFFDYVIDAPDLLGGLDQEGGVQGTLRFYKGTDTQTYDIEMATLANALLPGFRRVAYGVLRNFYVGTSPRLKGVSFLVERLPNSLGVTGNKHYIERTVTGHQDITTSRDCNIVCAIYECITMGVWGAHIGADQLEINSWRDAANTTWEEGLGFSTILIAPQDIDSLVQGWLRYIDATVYEDVATGLLKIKLVREADLSGAPAFTADQISDVKATRVSYSELRGTVKVTYTDANRNYETGGVMARNSAVTRALGGATDLEVVELPGFSQTGVAQKAAGQLLRASSYPLSKIEITGDQSLNQLNPGQPFHLTWSRPSINAYFRVTKVNIREITEGGVIVHAIEDIFAAASNTFTPPPSTGIGGAGDVYPRTIQQYLKMEMPYHLRRNDNRSFIFGAVQPNLASIGFKFNLASYLDDPTVYGWMTAGSPSSAIPQWGGSTLSSITIAASLPGDIVSPDGATYDAGGSLLLVDAELMAYRTVIRNPDGTVTFGTVARAVLDTTPAAHSTTSRVYVLATARVRRLVDLLSDAFVLHASALSQSLTTGQAVGTGLSFDVQPASRALRPYPPGHLKVNGAPWPSGAVSYPAVVTWVPRTRLAGAVVLQDDAAGTPEDGTTYRVEVTDPSGLLLEVQTTSGLTATLVSAGPITISVWAVRAGLLSWQPQRVTVLAASLPAGRLTLAGYAPGKVITPVSSVPTAALALTGRAPALTVSSSVLKAPGAGAAALAGQAPTALVPVSTVAAPGAGAAALAGQAPSTSPAGFRYWRLTVQQWMADGNPDGSTSSSTQTRVAELRYFTAGSTEWPTSAMTSASAPSPFVVSALTYTASFFPYTAFDKSNAGNGWVANGNNTGPSGTYVQPWLQIDMGSAQEFASISLAPDDNVSTSGGYWITDFKIEASNTGSFSGEQTTMLTQSGLARSGWTDNTPRTFSF